MSLSRISQGDFSPVDQRYSGADLLFRLFGCLLFGCFSREVPLKRLIYPSGFDELERVAAAVAADAGR